jgi:GT2 family glycosyltransferase
MASQPVVTIIVPMYNAAEHLATCLGALQPLLNERVECLVVNDGSTDDSVAIASGMGFRVLSTEGQYGAGAARNVGAREARGKILLFLDADVSVHSDTIERVLRAFAEDATLAAVCGSYDDAPSHPTWLSQWRNLLHCYTHQTAKRDTTTFWGGCGALRREAFLDVGGFDESFRFFQDAELGTRLYRTGWKLRLDPDIQVRHHKRWTFMLMVHTDVLGRAIPWTRIMLRERRMPSDLNLKWSQRASVVLVLLSVLLFGTGVLDPRLFAPVGLCLLSVVMLNFGFYRFLAARRGLGFVAAMFPIHLLFYCYSACGLLYGIARHVWSPTECQRRHKTDQ